MRRFTGLLRAFALAAALSAVAAAAVAAEVAAGLTETPLSTVLAVRVIDGEVLAIDAEGGGQTRERLRLGEEVLWKGARGKVGVVLTSERVLAVATQSGSWQELGVRRVETLPDSVLLGDRVALIVTSERVIGFNGSVGRLVAESLGPRERLLLQRVGENVGVAITDRRALGLSPLVAGFVEQNLFLHERIDAVEADANLATITTDRRLLVFRTPTASWEERRLGIH